MRRSSLPKSIQLFLFFLTLLLVQHRLARGRSRGVLGRGSIGVEAALVLQLIECVAGIGQALDVS
jgi:hypothetical protein